MVRLLDLYKQAVQSGEPRVFPIPTHADDRGWSLMNLFLDVLSPAGQINFTEIVPGGIKAWHRHQHQTDFWLVLGGMLKCAMFRQDPPRMWRAVVGAYHPGIVIIPRGLWHGCVNTGIEPARLLYYVDQKYNAAQPDEERQPWDWPEPISVGGAWYGIEPR